MKNVLQGLYVTTFLIGVVLGIMGIITGYFPLLVAGVVSAFPVTMLLFIFAEIFGFHNQPLKWFKESTPEERKFHQQNRMIAILAIFSTFAYLGTGSFVGVVIFLLITLFVGVVAYNIDTRQGKVIIP